jgi:hypothetical protein
VDGLALRGCNHRSPQLPFIKPVQIRSSNQFCIFS